MPAVKVIRPFKRRGEIVTPGTILEIPDDVLPKLAGMVELIRRQHDPPTPQAWLENGDLHRMVGEYLAEVDRLGRPWPARFLVDMPAADREQLLELELSIDKAVLTGDAVAVAELLDAWRALLRRHLH